MPAVIVCAVQILRQYWLVTSTRDREGNLLADIEALDHLADLIVRRSVAAWRWCDPEMLVISVALAT